MSNKNIFPLEIYSGTNYNPDLDKKILEDLELSKLRNNGTEKSNRGGFQTNGIINTDLNEELSKMVIKHIPNYLEQGRYNITVANAWINENKKGDYNVMHTHPKSEMSAVYYVKLPKDNDNHINFYRPNLELFQFSQFEDNFFHKSFTWIHKYQVKENNLLIFPAYLFHDVPANTSDEKRITVAMNIKIKSSDNA
jgi:uncharacterized protein (TIGR02466 family)